MGPGEAFEHTHHPEAEGGRVPREEACREIARQMAASGHYEYITFNRAGRTTTGRVNDSYLRPDIMGVRLDKRVDIWVIVL